jgi:SnoaL-like domain
MAETMRDIEAACIAVTLDFFRALDAREHEAAAALIVPGGVWERQGKLLEGRPAILAGLEQRPSSRATCHIITNLSVDIVGPGHAFVHFYLTAYEGAQVGSETPTARLVGIRYGTDEMVRLPDGWRIKEKRSQAVMRGA